MHFIDYFDIVHNAHALLQYQSELPIHQWTLYKLLPQLYRSQTNCVSLRHKSSITGPGFPHTLASKPC